VSTITIELASSGDTISNCKKLIMVSPELLSLSRRSTSLPGARKWVAPSALAPPAPDHKRAYVENGQTTAEDLCGSSLEINRRTMVHLGRRYSLGRAHVAIVSRRRVSIAFFTLDSSFQDLL